jgi:hypothetical protein
MTILNEILNPTPRRTGWLIVGRNVTWAWTCVIALQITDPSSRQRGRPTWRRKKVIATQRSVKSGHLLQMGPDTKTNWSTDRRSQYNLSFNLNSNLVSQSEWTLNSILFLIHVITFLWSVFNSIPRSWSLVYSPQFPSFWFLPLKFASKLRSWGHWWCVV